MTQVTSLFISLILFLACGRADQSADSQLQAPAEETFSEANAEPIPAQHVEVGPEGMGPEAPPAEPIGPLAQQEGPEEPEGVTPPTQVTGTYMNAKVLVELEGSVDIGISAYHQGLRVRDYPASLSAMWTVGQPADPQVTATLVEAGVPQHDVILQLRGESLKAVRAQLPLIELMLQVKDLKLGKTDTKVQQSVQSALQDSAARN